MLPLLAGLGLIAAALAADDDDEQAVDSPATAAEAAPAVFKFEPLAEPDEPADEQEPEEDLAADEPDEVSEHES